MRKGLDQTHEKQEQRELRRRYANQQGDGAEPKRGDCLIQDMVTIIRPESHLPLRVVD